MGFGPFIVKRWPTLDLEMDKLPILNVEHGFGPFGSPNGQEQ